MVAEKDEVEEKWEEEPEAAATRLESFVTQP